MILQALCEYYQRKASDSDNGVAPEGFSYEQIPFLVEIDENGAFVNIQDTRSLNGKKLLGNKFLVPKAVSRTAGIKANLLWDKADYSLGIPDGGKLAEIAKKAEKGKIKEENIESEKEKIRQATVKRQAAFVEELKKSCVAEEKDVKAVISFLEHDPLEKIKNKLGSENEIWKTLNSENPNVSFIILGESTPVCSSHKEALSKTSDSTVSEKTGICLVTGENTSIDRIHPMIKNVVGAQSSGAAIISFNKDSFTSFGNKQNFNAPVSKSATFAYTEALNMLLDKNSKNKMRVGDMTMVFWSEKSNQFEDFFNDLWALPTKDNPDADIDAVRKLYSSINTGVFIEDSATRFYILGLSPNAARLSIRYWQIGTIDDISNKLKQHFDDIDIVKSAKDKGQCALMAMLASLVRKLDDLPPNLCGDMTKAVLQGLPYPQMLLQLCLRRIRTDFEAYPSNERMRVALLKAFLNRKQRIYKKTTDKEITMSLDTTNKNTGYLLGRLFATLEKLQEEAQGGNLNSTIKDRYYGAASSTPCTVFPQLFKLKNFHLAKLSNPGRKTNFEKLIGEITDGISAEGIPAHLSLDNQARFAIGYYHQRQDLFKSKEVK